MPVSSSTDWQAAFGFGSSKQQQEDDLGFDPFDVTRRALADLIEKELCVGDSSLSPNSFPHRSHRPLLNKGLCPPCGPTCCSATSTSSAFRPSWNGSTSIHSNLPLNQTVSGGVSPSQCSFLELRVLPGHHSAGQGGFPITGKTGSSRSQTNHKSICFVVLFWLSEAR